MANLVKILLNRGRYRQGTERIIGKNTMSTSVPMAPVACKALSDLEKELQSISPLSDVDLDRIPEDPMGEQEHLPCWAAASYLDDPKLQSQYQGHVDACDFCQAILDNLEPPDTVVRQLANEATRLAAAGKRRRRSALPFAIAASILTAALTYIGIQRFSSNPKSQSSSAKDIPNLTKSHKASSP